MNIRGYIETIHNGESAIFPVTLLEAIYNKDGRTLSSILDSLSYDSGGLAETIEDGLFIIDQDGYITFSTTSDGVDFVLSEDLKDKMSSGNGEKIHTPYFADLAEINHIITAGQSLGWGAASNEIIDRNMFVGYDLVFNTGLRLTNDTNPTDFINNNFAVNETPSYGTAFNLFSRGCLVGCGKKILSTNISEGATRIDQWVKGASSGYYERFINAVTTAFNLARSKGMTYRVAAITWTQGEHDMNTNYATYRASMVSLRSDLLKDIKEITGTDVDIPFIIYQCSNTNIDVAMVQYDLGIEDDSGFYLATPIYHEVLVDQWHLTSAGYRDLGLRYGFALDKVLANRDWKPIHPTGFKINTVERYVDVEFYTPHGSLVFEVPSFLKGTLQNYGFQIKTPSSGNLLQAVNKISDKVIRFYLSKVADEMVLHYGKETDTTNVIAAKPHAGYMRDSMGDIVRNNIKGEMVRQDNWCPMLEYALK